MKRYLVIAHYEGTRTPLVKAMTDLAKQQESTFHVIVPATPAPTDQWTWSEQKSYEIAKVRLDALLGELSGVGAPVTGDVLNYSALAAVEQALQTQPYDELIVATPEEPEARPSYSEYELHVRRLSNIPIRHIAVSSAKPVERA